MTDPVLAGAGPSGARTRDQDRLLGAGGQQRAGQRRREFAQLVTHFAPGNPISEPGTPAFTCPGGAQPDSAIMEAADLAIPLQDEPMTRTARFGRSPGPVISAFLTAILSERQSATWPCTRTSSRRLPRRPKAAGSFHVDPRARSSVRRLGSANSASRPSRRPRLRSSTVRPRSPGRFSRSGFAAALLRCGGRAPALWATGPISRRRPGRIRVRATDSERVR